MLEKRSYGRWTKELQARFIDILSTYGDVHAAAHCCGMSRQSVYRLRQRDAAFALKWDRALKRAQEAAVAQMEAALAELRERREQRNSPSRTPSTASTSCQLSAAAEHRAA